jgi:RHH-type rel operon transcriptional repressor/antitoxin RelB
MYYSDCRRDFMGNAISVRLPESLIDKLDSVAKETERPRSFIIQKALESYLEDYVDFLIALDRLRDKDDEIISGAELRKNLGL